MIAVVMGDHESSLKGVGFEVLTSYPTGGSGLDLHYSCVFFCLQIYHFLCLIMDLEVYRLIMLPKLK